MKALPYRPVHRLNARASFGVRRARARMEVDVQSEQFTNRTNTLSLPARALVNAGLTSIVFDRPEISLAVDAKNLFDVQTSDFAGDPLPGRALFVTLSFSTEGHP